MFKTDIKRVRGARSRCVWIERINLKLERLGRVDDDALQVEALGEWRECGEAVDLDGTVHLRDLQTNTQK